MILGVLVTVFLSLTAGAAIDNQYPKVGETITQQEQVCEK